MEEGSVNLKMAGDYRIISEVTIGNREILLGVNEESQKGQKYMCAFGEATELFEFFSDGLASDNYLEIAEIFGKRVTEEAEKVRGEIEKLGIPLVVMTEKECDPVSKDDSIIGKVIVIDSKVLRPDFQRSDRQLYLVTGGFGAAGHSRGSAVFCKNLYDGKMSRFERSDVLGTAREECLPDWAKKNLKKLEQQKRAPEKER